MNRENEKGWIPEILYESEESGLTSHIPFIHVPDGEDMPNILFIFESRDTGDFEPGTDGEDLPVTEIDLHQYADMNVLKANLSPVEYDNVRFALGLEPVKTAAIKGKRITSNVRVALDSSTASEDALKNI